MRIVYLIGALNKNGGAERVLVNKANYLADHYGYDVHIIIADQKKLPLCYYISEKVVVHDLTIGKYLMNVAIPILTFFINIKKLRKVYEQKIHSINPDVTIVMERGYEDFIIPEISNIKKIRESHLAAASVKIKDNASKSFKEKMINLAFTALYKIQMKKYDYVILLTDRDKAERKFLKQTEVIPNVVSKFEGSVTSRLENRKAISVGRLDKNKNFKDAILVWSNVIKLNPEWTLHIYGQGPERENLNDLIKQQGLENHVFLEGATNEIEKKYQESSLFLFTSIAEGFPMVLLEAMQFGIPVISYNCPCGPDEIISNGIDGYLVNVYDRQEMASYINDLIHDKDKRRKMGEMALEKSKRYLPENIMPKWDDLFKRISNEARS